MKLHARYKNQNFSHQIISEIEFVHIILRKSEEENVQIEFFFFLLNFIKKFLIKFFFFLILLNFILFTILISLSLSSIFTIIKYTLIFVYTNNNIGLSLTEGQKYFQQEVKKIVWNFNSTAFNGMMTPR